MAKRRSVEHIVGVHRREHEIGRQCRLYCNLRVSGRESPPELVRIVTRMERPPCKHSSLFSLTGSAERRSTGIPVLDGPTCEPSLDLVDHRIQRGVLPLTVGPVTATFRRVLGRRRKVVSTPCRIRERRFAPRSASARYCLSVCAGTASSRSGHYRYRKSTSRP